MQKHRLLFLDSFDSSLLVLNPLCRYYCPYAYGRSSVDCVCDRTSDWNRSWSIRTTCSFSAAARVIGKIREGFLKNGWRRRRRKRVMKFGVKKKKWRVLSSFFLSFLLLLFGPLFLFLRHSQRSFFSSSLLGFRSASAPRGNASERSSHDCRSVRLDARRPTNESPCASARMSVCLARSSKISIHGNFLF